MIYEVEIAGRGVRVEATGDGRLLLDDRVIAFEARDLERGLLWSVLVEGRSHEVALLGGEPPRVLIDGVEVRASIADERALASRRDRRGATGGRHEIRAPMPGLLKAVHVREGDIVDRDAALATLEAMKMENELRAPARGRVQRLAVAAGVKVESGALIAVVVDEPA